MKNCATCSNGKLVMLSVGCPRSVHLPSTIVMHSKYAMNPFYVSHALTQTKCGPRFHVRSLARNNHTHTRSVYAYPELFFGALPAPLLFFSGAPPGPTGSLLGPLLEMSLRDQRLCLNVLRHRRSQISHTRLTVASASPCLVRLFAQTVQGL
jgi:hypothetical protein